ncbi:MAG: YdeI/OmpD-associated family protein [Nocardioides sp.]
MGVQDDAERLEAASLADWTAWLAAQHRDAPGVWLVSATKASGRQSFDYEDAVIEAVRFGWIDSTLRKLDPERNMQYFSPRRPGSGWSRSNKLRIERLEREGRLEPAGREAVEVARANGSWELLDSVEDLVVPDDLAGALDARPGAREHWESFTPSARRQLLGWIVQAKRPATRGRRVTETADKAALGLRANEPG